MEGDEADVLAVSDVEAEEFRDYHLGRERGGGEEGGRVLEKNRQRRDRLTLTLLPLGFFRNQIILLDDLHVKEEDGKGNEVNAKVKKAFGVVRARTDGLGEGHAAIVELGGEG